MIKRLVDVVIASCLLLLLLPLLLLVAFVILLTSPGPVLFRQVRMGRGFQTFEILKLRTMAHAQVGLAYTLGPDPRITWVGKWLRRTKLDELPQLWNVLRGDMSLVGPRPVLPELTYEFRESYIHLLQARPGLTDPASLKYSQETRLLAQAPDPMHFFKTVVTPDKIRISSEYQGKANVWTDAGVMVMTVLVCCFPSLGRVYGEMPQVREETPRRAQALVSMDAAADGSIFSHEMVQQELAGEAGSEKQGRPWIRRSTPGSQSRIAPVSVKEGASHL